MIAFLDGEVAIVDEESVVVAVAGVGYRVHASTAVLGSLQVGEVRRFYTHQHVREDALILFGFLDDSERRLFVRLQSATGVGPKLALQMFSHLTAGQIVQALRLEDAKTLSRVPGIGAKTASRMGLELKDRLDDLNSFPGDAMLPARSDRSFTTKSTSALPSALSDIQAALSSLGYSERESTPLLLELADQLADLPLGEAVKRCLRSLARG